MKLNNHNAELTSQYRHLKCCACNRGHPETVLNLMHGAKDAKQVYCQDSIGCRRAQKKNKRK